MNKLRTNAAKQLNINNRPDNKPGQTDKNESEEKQQIHAAKQLNINNRG